MASTVSAKDERSARMVIRKLYGASVDVSAGILTPCRYQAFDGRVVPLRHDPLNAAVSLTTALA